ncbi:MAG: pyridoxamine 5'-phosphate oxidase family protein [Acidimicrobiia bacterium]|nr:pyridoxamine 5'-phosphate oxidase family protein [Acidimicrobiia bacterium]
MKTKNLAELYDLPALDWEAASATLPEGQGEFGADNPGRYSAWLSTTNPDGSPHLTGIGTRWDDGAYWIVSGRNAQKGRNLERDPRCAVSLATKNFDIVVEGTAELVTDPEVVSVVAERFANSGWPCEPDESGTALTAPYSAPSAGPPPWHIYRMTPTKATALLVGDPGGATAWYFDD